MFLDVSIALKHPGEPYAFRNSYVAKIGESFRICNGFVRKWYVCAQNVERAGFFDPDFLSRLSDGAVLRRKTTISRRP